LFRFAFPPGGQSRGGRQRTPGQPARSLETTNRRVRLRPVQGFIEQAGMRWGVVTNKPGWLTVPLLEQLGLDRRCACVVSGDTLPERKPHPMQLLHAAALLGLEPRECVYLGDAERDVQAARNAGMIPLVAGFGYLNDGEDPSIWQPEAVLDRPHDLLDWLGLRN
jgi:phosphoglycolate phosphatase